MKKVKTILSALYLVCAAVFLIWLVASYIDVVMHNLSDCTYWKHNLFTILINLK